jgi:nucleoid-associated protein YgaU
MHTIGVEFRTQDTDTLKRTAQNYYVGHGVDTGTSNSGSSDESSSGASSESSDDSDGGSVSSNAAESTVSTVSYTVAAGDTLSKIAQRFYGSAAYWKKIYNDNSAIIKNPNKIYVGQVITIYLTNTGSGSSSTASANSTASGTYTVAAGDNLWIIAQKVYGKNWKWRTIYDANRKTITDPGRIYIGQKLIIPQD